MTPPPNRRRLQQRARAALCAGLGLLIMCQTLGLVWIETRRPAWADPEFGLRLQSYQRLSADTPAEPVLAVIGSSRFACGIDTEVWVAPDSTGSRSPTAANLSLAGGSALWQQLVLRRLTHYGPRPQRVLLELFPRSLLGGETDFFGSRYEFPVHRLRYTDLAPLAEIMPDQAPRHARRWWRNNGLLPLTTHGVALWNSWCPLFKTDDLFVQTPYWRQHLTPTGFGPWGIPQPSDAQRAEAWRVAESQYSQLLKTGQLDQRAIDVYRGTLAWCAAQQVDVAALVLMPESPRFRQWYSSENWQATRRVADQLTREFHVRVIDARDWLSAEEAFADGHHLLPPAAREFTSRLWAACHETAGPGSDSAAQQSVAEEAPAGPRR